MEQDDPQLYTTKIKYIEENSVEGMELTFSEDVYVNGKLVDVRRMHSASVYCTELLFILVYCRWLISSATGAT